MQKIPKFNPSLGQRFVALMLVVLVPMLGIFQCIGIKYQRQLTKQCIFNQMQITDLELVFLEKQEFNPPQPGSEFWINGNKYDAIRIMEKPGGWMVWALNDKVEKMAEMALRSANTPPMHPTAKTYQPYNKNWVPICQNESLDRPIGSGFLWNTICLATCTEFSQGVFQPPEFKAIPAVL